MADNPGRTQRVLHTAAGNVRIADVRWEADTDSHAPSPCGERQTLMHMLLPCVVRGRHWFTCSCPVWWGTDTDSHAPAPCMVERQTVIHTLLPCVMRGRHWFTCSCPMCGERQTLIHMLLPPAWWEADTDSHVPAPCVVRNRHWFTCSFPWCGEGQTLIHMLLPPVWWGADTDSHAPTPGVVRGRQWFTCSFPWCGEWQTLIHVLNYCKVARDQQRYNTRHDKVLEVIVAAINPKHRPTNTSSADVSRVTPSPLTLLPRTCGLTLCCGMRKSSSLSWWKLP